MKEFYCQDKESLITPEEMVKHLCESQGAKAEDLALDPSCIITFLPDDHYALVKRTGARPIDAWTKAFRNVCRGTVEGRPVILANSAFGATNAVMLLEELAAYGVLQILALGYCGALQEGIHIGDLIMPTDAIREEGASFHYLRGDLPSQPDDGMQKRLSRCLSNRDEDFHMGRIWTTDAPYRETRKKITTYQRAGVLGVEMEMSAVFALGRARGLRVGAALAVSDELSGPKWVSGFFSNELGRARGALQDLLLEVSQA